MACGCQMRHDTVPMSTPLLPVKKCLKVRDPTEWLRTALYSELIA